MKVLLSHVNEEAPVASVLKEWIETSLDRDVHLRGEVQDVELGEQRLAEVDQVLGEARVVLLLCSERSIGRPWLSFESGCAWFKRVPVIALCHDGCTPARLPPPLCSFPALDLADPASCQTLLGTLASHLGKKRVPRIDSDLMVAEVGAAMGRGAVSAPPAPARTATETETETETPGPPVRPSSEARDPRAMRPGDAPDSAPAARHGDVTRTRKVRELSLLAAMEHRTDFTCTAPGLAAMLNEQEWTIRETLEGLVESQLLTLRVSTNLNDPEARYAFTEEGRAYLATHTE